MLVCFPNVGKDRNIMPELQYRSPVEFPEGWVRTSSGAARHDPKFAQNVTFEEALRNLKDELNLLRCDGAVLYSNFDDIAYAAKRSKRGHSEGVGLKIRMGDVQAFMACDKWYTAIQNIHALHLAIRSIRMCEEWGIATAEYMLSLFDTRQAKASSHVAEGEHGQPEWMNILGLGATATLNDANAIYRHRAKIVSDDQEALTTLNQAIESARRMLS
jgi:hypothetical protein